MNMCPLEAAGSIGLMTSIFHFLYRSRQPRRHLPHFAHFAHDMT